MEKSISLEHDRINYVGNRIIKINLYYNLMKSKEMRGKSISQTLQIIRAL